MFKTFNPPKREKHILQKKKYILHQSIDVFRESIQKQMCSGSITSTLFEQFLVHTSYN